MKKFYCYVNEKRKPFAEGRLGQAGMEKHNIASAILANYDKLIEVKKITVKVEEEEDG